MKYFPLLLMILVGFSVAAESFYCGVAIENITPPSGFRRDGNFHEIITTGVHDSLFSKAIVLKQNDIAAALVFCDLTSVTREISQAARKKISQKTGLPFENILIAATHAHTAPLYSGVRRDFFNEKAIAEKGTDPNEPIDYKKFLISKIVKAVEAAANSARPVQIYQTSAEQTGLSFHRRFYMKPGSERLRQPGATVRMNPGVKHPDIIKAAGTIDPFVGFLLVKESGTNKPLTSLTNFALHLDTKGGTEFSADYPFYLEQELRKKLGNSLVSLFGLRPCGDINHIDVSTEKRLTTSEIGLALSATVIGSLPELLPVNEPDFAVSSRSVEVDFKNLSSEKIALARRNIAELGSRDIPWLEQVDAYSIMDILARGGKKLPVEIQAFRLSDKVVLLGLPGEIFVDLSLQIQNESPFSNTFIFELCNDAPGYIPTIKGFNEGGYETVNSRIKAGGGEIIAKNAIELLKELRN